MQIRKVKFFYVLPILIFTASSFAQQENTLDGRIGAMQEQINELQQEIKETNARHSEEIRLLREQIELLRQSRAEASKQDSQEPQTAHKAAPVGSYGALMNPDISVIANIQTNFNDDKSDENRNKVRVKEAELALQGYLYPGIRGDLIAAFEQEYEADSSTTEVDLEEAYVSFLDLPYGLQAEVGRKLLGFGKLNAVHQHHRPFADTPLVLQNFFGEHNWFDDGASVSTLISNPWDIYIKTSMGIYNGRDPGHAHEDEEEAHETEPVDWNGHVYLLRTSANLPLDDSSDIDLGYSFACDEPRDNKLHGVDLTYSYRWPYTYRKLKWQNELLFSDIDGTDTEGMGGYSLLKLTLDKNWEAGSRYDWSQTPSNDRDHQWAITPFVTYYFTESFYARAQYRYRELLDDHEPENAFFLQLVWGLGPHSHRLED